MSRFTLLVLFCVFGSAEIGLAQEARNAVYGEIGGSAIGLSVNYERGFTERWKGRIGASVVTGESEEDTDTTFLVPLTASWISHPALNHHLELGGGVTVVFGDRQDFYSIGDDDEQFSTAIGTAIIGYRYQKPEGGFQFRAALTPLIGGGEVFPWIGVSFGYAR